MKGDGIFFLGVLAFFFILWFATGGPTKPISFAGPYITPITDIDSVQQGYGDTPTVDFRSGSVWSNLMSGSFSGGANLGGVSNPSPYRGQVRVSGTGGTGSEDPEREYVTLRVSGTDSIDITGWRLVSGASGRGARIPEGAALPRSGRVNDTGRIVLNPGDEAIVVTGEAPTGVSFKENKCTGYFMSRQEFYPSLSNQCPSPYQEFEKHYSGNELRDDKCYTLMRSSTSCRTPSDSGVSNACTALIDDYLTYNGCVEHHKTDSDFAGDTWRIYLEYENSRGRSDELWKSSRDAVKLLDTEGRTVDLYTY
ncbi:MAG: hypothetical protein V4682_03560 [Patescibacteria group bacterium]